LCRVEQFLSDDIIGAFNVWDHGYRFDEGADHPTLQIATLPWFESSFVAAGGRGDRKGLSAKATLWLSESSSPPLLSVDVKPQMTQETLLDGTRFQVSHQGDKIVVRVTKEPVGTGGVRGEMGKGLPGTEGCFDWIVRSSSTPRAIREYAVDGSEAVHMLFLSGRRDETITVEIHSFRQAIEAMDTKLVFDREATPWNY
jgi:hypothetical protein